MGIIKRQGIKSTLVSYASVLISAIAVLFIYPTNDEIYGHAIWLYNIAILFLPLASGGMLSLIIKFFPAYKKEDDKTYNGFLTLILAGLAISFIIFLLLWYMFRDALIRGMTLIHIPNVQLIESYEWVILILIGVLILMRFLVMHSWNSMRIVVPNLIERLGYKIYLPAIVLAYGYFGWDVLTFSYWLVGFFIMSCVVLLVYLKTLGTLNFGKIKRPGEFVGYKEMSKYGLFGSLNLLGANLAMRLDTIMIPLFMDMMRNGFYGKTSFIANILEYPTRAINQISGPIISKAWEENDLDEIAMIYKKSSANLFLLGGLVFLLIWYGLDDVISFSRDPSTFPHARMIFLLLASGKLFDMLTSVNSHIIILSKDYKVNLFFLLFLGGLNVVLNARLIPIHGIVGAAMATAISLFMFNLMKLAFIYFRFGLQPFSIANLKSLVLIALFLVLYHVLPDSGFALVNLGYKSLIVGLGYVSLAYFWRISEEANELGLGLIKRFLKT